MSEFLGQWQEKRDATEVIQLQGGPARVKVHASLQDLAAAGHVPIPLLAKIESLREEATGDPIAAGVKHFDTLLEVYDAVTIAVMVDPPVTKDGGPESMAVRDVLLEDKQFLYARASLGVAAFESFRQSKGELNGVAHSGDGVPHAAVEVVGD